MRALTVLPVFNEAGHVVDVLREVRRYAEHILVVDDGSTDSTAQLLANESDIAVVRHEPNRGYGAALKTAFDYAVEHDFDAVVTIDCDGQHEPQRIPQFLEMLLAEEAAIVSGSRYLRAFPGDTPPPEQRRQINHTVTAELNSQLQLNLTDAFCGFKAYRSCALQSLELTVDGYAMPLELWVQAARAGLKIVEYPVPLIYLDEDRSFGGQLDDSDTRLSYYRGVIAEALSREPYCLRSPCEDELR
jgi:glycosyltransferase involved in cell wall biosynthesis